MLHAFTVDLEYWYSAEMVARHHPPQNEDQIEEAVAPLLALLDRYQARATFFVLGAVAQAYPELVVRLHREGHEIASHAYSHRTLKELGPQGLEEELERSVEVLAAATGEKPLGFRAPSCSLDQSTRWALPLLHKHGFKYDSSIFPVKTPLYGVPGAPLHPYRVSFDDVRKEDHRSEILEFPLTVINLGVKIPVAGGFYLRLLPGWFLKLALKRVGHHRPAMLYIHPWETYPLTPRLKGLGPLERFVTYYGIGSALRKVELLLRAFRFAPARELLGL